MKKVVAILVFAFATAFVFAQKKNNQKTDPKGEIKVALKAENWETKQNRAKFADHNGLPSIEVAGDLVTAKNINFASGTIEFDVEFVQGFVGIYFRRQSADESEFFYLRGVENPPTSIDAVQYAPIIKKVNMWDMYYDYQTGANFKKNEWTHIKMVISGMQMLVYVNDMSHPTLRVPRLEGNTKDGSIAFEGQCFVSNLVLKPNETEGLSPTEGFDITANDIYYIRNWQVSQPAPLPVGQEPTNNNMPDIQTQWQPVAAERRGLINITRLYGQSTSRRFVWLRSKIVSNTARKIRVNLGFSDEVWVFVNDRATYVDKNLYGQSMRKKPEGRISIENSSFEIQLSQGVNDLVIGLANDFYGWGIVTHLEDLNGIELKTDYEQEVVNKDFEKYFGLYSSKDLPVKVKISQRNNKLTALPTAESPIVLEKLGGDRFRAEQMNNLTFDFLPAENKFIFKNGSQTYEFVRE